MSTPVPLPSLMPRLVNHRPASLALSSVSLGTLRVICGPAVSMVSALLLCTLAPYRLSKRALKLRLPASRVCKSAPEMLTCQVPSALTVALQVFWAKEWLLARPSMPTTTLRPMAMLVPPPGTPSLTLPASSTPACTSLALRRLSSACTLSQLMVGAAVLTTHSPLLMSVLVPVLALKPLGKTETTTS